jgi:hypothetical protein
VSYNADGTMLSGSAITTLGNTLLNAFVYYAAIRASRIPARCAFEYMSNHCILYGDDSAGPTYIKEQFWRVCADCGLDVKEEDCTYGLSFLGRIYYKNGSGFSIMDPRRMLSKIHITTAPLNVPDDIAACNRAHGILSAVKGEFWIEMVCRAILKRWGNLQLREDYLSSEEIFLKDMKSGIGLPIEEVLYVRPIVEKILDLKYVTLDAVAQDYARGLEPCGWLDCKPYHNSFDEKVYITDIYSSTHFQICLEPGQTCPEFDPYDT